jgi:DNA-binding NtrC family response regulator
VHIDFFKKQETFSKGKKMKKKILIVDDDWEMRSIEKTIIADIDDFEIIEASNGKEAVDLLRYTNVDLLITDICMPEMNGIELVEKLRASGFSIPILIISGTLDVNIRTHLFPQKQIQFIEKPFSMERLSNVVENLIN